MNDSPSRPAPSSAPRTGTSGDDPRAEVTRDLPPSLGAGPAGRDGPKPPSQPDAGGPLTHPPSKDHDATQGLDCPDAGPAPGLTAFLSPPQADDELGRLGKYRVLKVLGHGGMGVVFQAEDPVLRRKVAVKAMLPALAAND